jgi:hypothetical protein
VGHQQKQEAKSLVQRKHRGDFLLYGIPQSRTFRACAVLLRGAVSVSVSHLVDENNVRLHQVRIISSADVVGNGKAGQLVDA